MTVGNIYQTTYHWWQANSGIMDVGCDELKTSLCRIWNRCSCKTDNLRGNLMVSNSEFAKQDQLFQKACEIAKVKPTRRQASKWRNRFGLAFQFRGSAVSWFKRQLKP